MTNASLARKLARMADRSGAQRPVALNRGMLIEERDPRTPHDLLAEEQDRRREALAERLLEIALETVNPHDFPDTSRVEDEVSTISTVTVAEFFEKLAHAALAAATVLYPEVPAQTEAEE